MKRCLILGLVALVVACGGPKEPFSVTLVSSVKQPKWSPSEGITKMVFVKGMSSTFINGTMQGFEAESGYEIAVVSLDISLNTADAKVPLGDAVALDSAGQEYKNLGEPAPLKQLEKNQRREFGFLTPSGTQLATVRLSNGHAVTLASK